MSRDRSPILHPSRCRPLAGSQAHRVARRPKRCQNAISGTSGEGRPWENNSSAKPRASASALRVSVGHGARAGAEGAEQEHSLERDEENYLHVLPPAGPVQLFEQHSPSLVQEAPFGNSRHAPEPESKSWSWNSRSSHCPSSKLCDV